MIAAPAVTSGNGGTATATRRFLVGTTLDGDACYRALRARDGRFDGLFYTGVTTTGVYCRPICPARLPARARCEFFARAAEAERAGFRACFRCRPELAPGLAPSDSIPRLVRAAAARIEAGTLNEGSVDALARELGVTARHLRRAMEAEMGVSPIELAQTRRLALAKQLLHDTTLALTDVAFASGFSSVRRFNTAFRDRFGRPPSALRRDGARADAGESIRVRLEYRAPLDWSALAGFLAARAVPGVEEVGDNGYRRTVRLGDAAGWVEVAPDPGHDALSARLSLSLAPKLPAVVARLRALFDLDAAPVFVADHLGKDPRLGPLVRTSPGRRVPGAFDAFELAARAVLGQQVSVRAATTLAGRLAATFGRPFGDGRWLFPSAADVARASPDRVAALGLPGRRARTLVDLARAFEDGRVELEGGAPPERSIGALLAIPGIGPWTAEYIAMRALRWPDAFPAGDLVVQRTLRVTSARAAEQRAEPWRPWRAYAVVHLWASVSPPSARP